MFRKYSNSDARVLLCGTNDCLVRPMTENHHPDTLMEATRLRRMMGSSLITDSFGESRQVKATVLFSFPANDFVVGWVLWQIRGREQHSCLLLMIF